MSEQSTEIEKPWCVYSFGLGLSGFGKITKDDKIHVFIRYSESQMYPLECWDPNYVTRFRSLDDAVEYYIEHRPGVDIRCRQSTPDEVREQARRSFPSYFKNKLKNK
ncbi:MAG: hypothetical protein ABIH65_03715 [Nanoarchaeota archaeon]